MKNRKLNSILGIMSTKIRHLLQIIMENPSVELQQSVAICLLSRDIPNLRLASSLASPVLWPLSFDVLEIDLAAHEVSRLADDKSQS